jgi:hypothetical protein
MCLGKYFDLTDEDGDHLWITRKLVICNYSLLAALLCNDGLDA